MERPPNPNSKQGCTRGRKDTAIPASTWVDSPPTQASIYSARSGTPPQSGRLGKKELACQRQEHTHLSRDPGPHPVPRAGPLAPRMRGAVTHPRACPPVGLHLEAKWASSLVGTVFLGKPFPLRQGSKRPWEGCGSEVRRNGPQFWLLSLARPPGLPLLLWHPTCLVTASTSLPAVQAFQRPGTVLGSSPHPRS